MADFWTLADWLPFSPDLNLLDFSTWSVLQEKVKQGSTQVGSTSVHHQALESDVTGLHSLDLLLFPPLPRGRHGKNGSYIEYSVRHGN
jgi:hypothetical protein